jgi:hypothetical protein
MARRLKQKIVAQVIAHLRGEEPPKFYKKWPKKRKAKSRRQRRLPGRPAFDPGPRSPALPRKDNRPVPHAPDPFFSPRKVATVDDFFSKIKPVAVCVQCRTASKGWHCSRCKRPRQSAGRNARAPRRLASDRVWRSFCKRFGLRYEERK